MGPYLFNNPVYATHLLHVPGRGVHPDLSYWAHGEYLDVIGVLDEYDEEDEDDGDDGDDGDEDTILSTPLDVPSPVHFPELLYWIYTRDDSRWEAYLRGLPTSQDAAAAIANVFALRMMGGIVDMEEDEYTQAVLEMLGAEKDTVSDRGRGSGGGGPAGGNGGVAEGPKRKRRSAADSGETGNDESDSDREANGGSRRRRRKERSADRRVPEGDPYDLPWDPRDLMGDAEDRRRLMAMSEVERESILAERKQKMQDAELSRKVSQRVAEIDSVERASRRLSGVDDRRLSRRQTGKEKRDQDLAQYQRQREQKKMQDSVRIRRSSYSSFEEESDGEIVDDARPTIFVKERDTIIIKERDVPKQRPPTKEEIHSIMVTREDFRKWVFAEWFEKAVTGAYCRLAIGPDPENPGQPKYRLVEIAKIVKRPKVYKITPESLFVDKGFLAKCGSSTSEFLFDVVSNSPFTEREFNRFLIETSRAGERFPDQQFIAEKKADLEKARNYVYTDEEISEEILRKKAVQVMPLNPEKEVTYLKSQLEIAMFQNDDAKTRSLRAELERVQAFLTRSEESTNAGLADVNRRNRASNFEQGLAAEQSDRSAAAKKGPDHHDPFARRKTAPKRVVDEYVADSNVDHFYEVLMLRQRQNLNGKDAKSSASSSGNNTPAAAVPAPSNRGGGPDLPANLDAVLGEVDLDFDGE
ncbi:hypothetical protein HK104_011114 [Borealophlyctis nickersoniae]|nr:hypothetical protein HK104_011114 [Borealophlyctis nickersoniae]